MKNMILRAVTIIGCFLALLFASIIVNGQARNEKPNILIIMADDLDSRQLSCYGGKNMQTPHIDQLADSGMRFTNMIASEAMCVPIRASLLTGLYPVRHGAYQNHKAVYDSLKSVCHYLGALGYRVGLTGKGHLTQQKKVFPFDLIPGFERNCISHTDEYFLDSIERYINRPGPYCLFVMSIDPHVPWSSGNASEFRPEDLIMPANLVDTRFTRRCFAMFLAEIRRLDNQVGDVMGLLRKNNQLDNTIVIFLGEQGPQFPGGKWTLWDYGVRSSMIVRWPEKVTPGSTSDALVQYEDVLPTLVNIGGGRKREAFDGINFLNILEGNAGSSRQYAYGIHNNIPAGRAYPLRSIRDKNYKFIWNLSYEKKFFIKNMDPEKRRSIFNSWVKKAQHDTSAAKKVQRIIRRPQFELYDLKTDPNELNNLAGDPKYAEKADSYKSKLEDWMHRQGDTGAKMDVVQKKRPKDLAKARKKSFTRNLNLSPGQSEQVYKLYLNLFTKKDELANLELSRAERKKRIKKLLDGRDKAFRNIFTNEQWQKLLRKRDREHGRK